MSASSKTHCEIPIAVRTVTQLQEVVPSLTTLRHLIDGTIICSHQSLSPRCGTLFTAYSNAANRRLQEQQMWRARQSQLQLDRGSDARPIKRSRSCSPGPTQRARRRVPRPAQTSVCRDGHASASDRSQSSTASETGSLRVSSAHSAGSREESDTGQPISPARQRAEEHLASLLSKGRVRGRGAVGSRADEPGPYLPVPATGNSLTCGSASSLVWSWLFWTSS